MISSFNRLRSSRVFFTGTSANGGHSSGIVMAPSLAYMERAYFDARQHGWSREPIVEMLTKAFVTEVAMNYFFESGYDELAPLFFAYLLDLRFEAGEVWVADSDGEIGAAALSFVDDLARAGEPLGGPAAGSRPAEKRTMAIAKRG